ncbi:MAG: hypothetical protein AAFY17_00010 [Cyanobacteria bacterium J06642_11]
MLGKLLGKKSGYYLELSDEEIAKIPEPPVESAPPAPQVQAVAGGDASDPATATVSADGTPAAASQATVLTTTPMTDTVELIRSAIAAAGNQTEKAAEPESTAPVFDYTTPVAKASRRRPGPSMSPFKDMVKNMKRTQSGF